MSLAVALAGCGALIAGCGGSSAAGTSSGHGASRRTTALVRAADISSDAAGYRMNMTMLETVAGQTLNLSAHGSFTPRTREGSMTMDMSLPTAVGGLQQLRIVMSKHTIYMKLPAMLTSQTPGARPWVSMNVGQMGKAAELPDFGSLLGSSSTLNDPGQYLEFLRAAADGSVTTVGPETIDGVQTTHYAALLQFSKLSDAVPAADRASAQKLISELQARASVPDIPVDVWIDGSDLVRRIMMNMKETVLGRQVDVAITENFLSYGVQPAPKAPDGSQTTNLLSLIRSGG